MVLVKEAMEFEKMQVHEPGYKAKRARPTKAVKARQVARDKFSKAKAGNKFIIKQLKKDIKKAKQDIKRHKLLIKQAKLTYKLSK